MQQALFVPGLLCTEALYAPQIDALAEQLAIKVADHRQHATMGDIAAHILGDAPERFVLAGLSMGGYIAFEILRQAGARVEALVLLDTSARPDAPDKTEARKELMAVAASEGMAPVVDRLLPQLIASNRLADQELVRTVYRMAADTGPGAFTRQQTAIMARPDSRPTLSGIKCPTLVIVGDQDSLTPPDLAREMADGIPGAKLAIIPESGHLSTLEQPAAVNEAIAGFLDEVRRAA